MRRLFIRPFGFYSHGERRYNIAHDHFFTGQTQNVADIVLGIVNDIVYQVFDRLGGYAVVGRDARVNIYQITMRIVCAKHGRSGKKSKAAQMRRNTEFKQQVFRAREHGRSVRIVIHRYDHGWAARQSRVAATSEMESAIRL